MSARTNVHECRCPCYCGARTFPTPEYSWRSTLKAPWARALDAPLAAYVRRHAMPEWMQQMYIRLAHDIEFVLDLAFRKWGLPGARVLVDGSIYKATALESSDVDLVVRTERPVACSVKHKLHRIIRAYLRKKADIWSVKFVPRRKTAEFEVETLLERALAAAEAEAVAEAAMAADPEAAAAVPGAAEANGSTAGIGAPDPGVELQTRLEAWRQPPGGAPGLALVRLSADLLFEKATVGEPLSDIVNPFRTEAQRIAVMAMKLYQKAGSLPGFKGYVVEASVLHVTEDFRPPSEEPGASPLASAAQAFYMTLGLFLSEPEAHLLDARVAPHSTVRSGSMFDRGKFSVWNLRAYGTMRDLCALARYLAETPVTEEEAGERLQLIFEQPEPVSRGERPEPEAQPTPEHEPEAAPEHDQAASPHEDNNDDDEGVGYEDLIGRWGAEVTHVMRTMWRHMGEDPVEEVLRRPSGPPAVAAAAGGSDGGGGGSGGSGGGGGESSGGGGTGGGGGAARDGAGLSAGDAPVPPPASVPEVADVLPPYGQQRALPLPAAVPAPNAGVPAPAASSGPDGPNCSIRALPDHAGQAPADSSVGVQPRSLGIGDATAPGAYADASNSPATAAPGSVACDRQVALRAGGRRPASSAVPSPVSTVAPAAPASTGRRHAATPAGEASGATAPSPHASLSPSHAGSNPSPAVTPRRDGRHPASPAAPPPAVSRVPVSPAGAAAAEPRPEQGPAPAYDSPTPTPSSVGPADTPPQPSPQHVQQLMVPNQGQLQTGSPVPSTLPLPVDLDLPPEAEPMGAVPSAAYAQPANEEALLPPVYLLAWHGAGPQQMQSGVQPAPEGGQRAEATDSRSNSSCTSTVGEDDRDGRQSNRAGDHGGSDGSDGGDDGGDAGGGGSGGSLALGTAQAAEGGFLPEPPPLDHPLAALLTHPQAAEADARSRRVEYAGGASVQQMWLARLAAAPPPDDLRTPGSAAGRPLPGARLRAEQSERVSVQGLSQAELPPRPHATAQHDPGSPSAAATAFSVVPSGPASPASPPALRAGGELLSSPGGSAGRVPSSEAPVLGAAAGSAGAVTGGRDAYPAAQGPGTAPRLGAQQPLGSGAASSGGAAPLRPPESQPLGSMTPGSPACRALPGMQLGAGQGQAGGSPGAAHARPPSVTSAGRPSPTAQRGLGGPSAAALAVDAGSPSHSASGALSSPLSILTAFRVEAAGSPARAAVGPATASAAGATVVNENVRLEPRGNLSNSESAVSEQGAQLPSGTEAVARAGLNARDAEVPAAGQQPWRSARDGRAWQPPAGCDTAAAAGTHASPAHAASAGSDAWPPSGISRTGEPLHAFAPADGSLGEASSGGKRSSCGDGYLPPDGGVSIGARSFPAMATAAAVARPLSVTVAADAAAGSPASHTAMPRSGSAALGQAAAGQSGADLPSQRTSAYVGVTAPQPTRTSLGDEPPTIEPGNVPPPPRTPAPSLESDSTQAFRVEQARAVGPVGGVAEAAMQERIPCATAHAGGAAATDDGGVTIERTHAVDPLIATGAVSAAPVQGPPEHQGAAEHWNGVAEMYWAKTRATLQGRNFEDSDEYSSASDASDEEPVAEDEEQAPSGQVAGGVRSVGLAVNWGNQEAGHGASDAPQQADGSGAAAAAGSRPTPGSSISESADPWVAPEGAAGCGYMRASGAASNGTGIVTSLGRAALRSMNGEAAAITSAPDGASGAVSEMDVPAGLEGARPCTPPSSSSAATAGQPTPPPLPSPRLLRVLQQRMRNLELSSGTL